MLKHIFSEFKKFAMRGNVMDMAVGIIIGGAFGKIVDSLVKDILMPPLGLLLGKVDFGNLYVVLKNGGVPGPYISLEAAKAAGAITLNAGAFLNSVISFVIIAFAVFLLVKGMNTLQTKLEHEEQAAEPTTKKCPYCCTDIAKDAVKCPNCTADLNKKD